MIDATAADEPAVPPLDGRALPFQEAVSQPVAQGFQSPVGGPALRQPQGIPGVPTEASPGSPGARVEPTWSAAANAGLAIGRGSQKAAVATAGFFTRFGRNLAGSF
jgi:hypothetical protein